MKQLFYSFIAVFALLFTGCADKDVVEAISNGDNQPGVTVSMSMEGDMGQTAAATRVRSNAIGYETNDANGFPTPVGLFDKGLNDGKEIADGTPVPIYLIFRSTDDTQPVTKVITNWIYKKGGHLTLLPSETFEMKAHTDLSKGDWYVCGILGGEMLSNQVKFNGYSEGHVSRDTYGNKVTWGANIPYIFGWRKLTTNAANKTIKAEKAVKFKQFGTIVRLRITNNTGFDFKYNGVRIITSNILCGQFDLSSFDDKNLVKSADLKDTEDSDVASAKSESYKKVFKPFKFYQRPLDDAAMTGGSVPAEGLIQKRRFRIDGNGAGVDPKNYVANYQEEQSGKANTALYYYDHTFLANSAGENFETVRNGNQAASYIYVWMAPQKQDVKIYDGAKEGTGSYKEVKVAKTQFLLMAEPTETSTGSKIVPTSINMLPAYGTLKAYESGANYPALGSVVYKFAPLSYVAKHDNFGTEAEVSSTENQDIAHTTRYTYSQVTANQSNIPTGFDFARNEYWRSFMAHYFAFAGLRNNGTGFNYSVGVVACAMLPGWTGPKRVFHSYSKGVKVNGNPVAYMLGMSKKPSYMSLDRDGEYYYGYAKTAASDPNDALTSGINPIPDWVTNNDYRFTIRWEDKNNAAVLTQRYLGPRFVLDMDDIANENFWAAPSNYGHIYPDDVKRVFPYSGVNVGSSHGSQSFWYFDRTSIGKSTQYWTPDDAPATGRYKTKGGGGNGPMLDINGDAPKQSVNFMGPLSNAGVMGGFFYYQLYKTVPVNGNDRGDALADPNFKLGFIMDGPIRLWKTTPYAD